MSHNVSLKGISIEDMDVLETALKELNDEYGTTLSLKRGAVASRNWGSTWNAQNGNRVIPGTVAVISTGDDASYDITLTKGADGKISMQTEALMINYLIQKFGIDREHALDVSSGNVCNLTNVGYGSNEQLGIQAALGRIVQRYSVITMENQAAMSGHTCRRELDAKTGVMKVVSTVR